MPERLEIGTVDPEKYMDPYCTCGHVRKEHDSEGSPDGKEACWSGWDEYTEGCMCVQFTDRRIPDDLVLDE